MCVEELAKVCGTTAVIVLRHTSLCCAPIYEHGTEEQKMKYLPDLLSGKKIGAFGLTEPNAGTDASGQQTVAVLEGDHYVLNGSKCFITNGTVADTMVVFAMTDPKAGNHGISAFIVEKTFPGFSTGKKEKKMGIRGSSTCDLIFEDCIVPRRTCWAKRARASRSPCRPWTAAESASPRRLWSGRGRHQRGRQVHPGARAVQEAPEPVPEHPVPAGRHADPDAGRSVPGVRAACKKENHEPYSVDAAMAKLFAAEAASDVTRRAVQLFGGYGYTREYPVERMMRDAKITEIYEGTSEVQRMVILPCHGREIR